MTTIELSRNFRINFYPDSNSDPDIQYHSEGFYGVDDEVSLTVEEAKQIIAELTKFVEAKEKK